MMKIDPSFGRHVNFLRDIARHGQAGQAVLTALQVTSSELAKHNPKRTAGMLRELSARLRRAA
jgi:hypothetical protein